MITMEARVRDPAAEAVLLGLLEFDGQQRRRLFRDFHISGIDPKELKRSYCQIMTARHFNSLLFSVKDSVSALDALHAEHAQTKAEKIRSAEKWLKLKAQRVKQISSFIKSLVSYRNAKRKARANRKRLRMPAKLRPLNLEALATERASLLKRMHHKKRYLASAKQRLLELQAEDRVSLCFGSKALFRKQFHLEENGYGSHAEWAADFHFARSTYAVFVGSKDETAGNQAAQYDVNSQTLSLRLPKTAEFAGHPDDRLVISGLRFPDKYLPHLQAAQAAPGLDAKKSDKVSSAVQVRIVKRKKAAGDETALYVQLTCKPQPVEIVTHRANGAIGIDLNADHLALCETDRFGNFIKAESLPFDLRLLTSDQAAAVLGDFVAAAVATAKAAAKPIAIEKLDFRKKKARLREEGPSYAQMLSQLAYAKFHQLILSRCSSEGVELIVLNPAYSSVIGAYKFHGLEISSHAKAALVLARRALGFSERAKVFHGTRKSPVRMACPDKAKSGSKDPGGKPRHRSRHVWSFWARNARAIRHSLVSGRKKTLRVSVAFGQTHRKHPLVAKAAGVMSLAELRRRQEDSHTGAQGGRDAARPATERRLVNRKVDQVYVS